MGDGLKAGWSEHEFKGADFGDARLERRLKVVAEQLAGRPEAPINQASEDWKATKAAYRFFDNEKVSDAGIFAPHQKRTVERMRGERVVIVAQDTTSANYSSHKQAVGRLCVYGRGIAAWLGDPKDLGTQRLLSGDRART
jgi:hypothetical protein